jgi:predicted adenine nucleotide alpha hydrolase (AANH) superfamily ATPase
VKKDSLLLHACCAPCAGHVYELINADFDVTVHFYNPNIAPFGEYTRRLCELEAYSAIREFPLVVGLYNPREWTSTVKVRRFDGERSERCMLCFRYRLEESFRYARDNSFDAVATVMSVSPHKDAEMLNEAGRSLKRRYGVGFLEADFKKNDGYRKSVEISRANGFYRQDYCGCVYSSMERKKTSIWNPAKKNI